MAGQYFSNQLLEGARNCVIGCGRVEKGSNVLILNLIGDPNDIIDDQTVHALATVAQEAGAKVSILSTAAMEKGWWDDVPPIVVGAFLAADVVINNTYAIGRPLRTVRDAVVRKGIVNVGSKARTTSILSSEYSRFPFQLSDEIAKCAGDYIDRGSTWRVVAANGTDISGKIGPAPGKGRGARKYGEYSGQKAYRPFPVGFFPVVSSVEANGVIVTEYVPPWEARHLGIPELRFSRPMKVMVENNRIVRFEGGIEAKRFQKFYESLVPHLGEDAWNTNGWHAGTHPRSRVYEAPNRYPDVWHAGYHTNPRVMHFHLGGSQAKEYDYPYMWEISCHVEAATIYIDTNKLYDDGHLTLLDHEEMRNLAAQYGDPDRLLSQVPLFD